VAGQLLRGGLAPLNKVAILILAGVIGLAGGWALAGGGEIVAVSWTPVLPMVKRLWTASFAIYAAGWTCLMLAAFYLIIDVMQLRGWSFPFVVVGVNSIFIYVLHAFVGPNFKRALQIFLAQPLSESPLLAPVALALLVLFVEWLICLWLYVHRVFVKL
jgi:heparan-alpha-glucosaminide N-acetyltransferase